MATYNFYLDKPDKKGNCPIHLRINCDAKQVKVATKEKISEEWFDKKKQLIKPKYQRADVINHYLNNLKQQAEELFDQPLGKRLTIDQVKHKLTEIVNSYTTYSSANLVKEQVPLYGKSFTFIDLFAGAGGFSEGFLQADYNNKFFDFVAASDINENCELTHVVRYNHQLGLDAKFLKQDITEPDFLDNLLQQVGSKKIDVVCGGPPCQSFSLAGRRRKFDKKDDLFGNYLEVIRSLRPKYFVMENVKGILTKEKGKIAEAILNEMRSIIDISAIPKLESFIRKLAKNNPSGKFLFDCISKRLQQEGLKDDVLDASRAEYIAIIDNQFKQLIPKIFDYKTSKTDECIATFRHGLNLLQRRTHLDKLRKQVIREKDLNYLDNDFFVADFDAFITALDSESFISKMKSAFALMPFPKEYALFVTEIEQALDIYTYSFDDCISRLQSFCNKPELTELDMLLEKIRLYNVNDPFVANASNYGVPQNRERVFFIGCRKDQKMITEIPVTVSAQDKVSVFEALYDLDFLNNNEAASSYTLINLKTKYNGSSDKMKSLLKQRTIDGSLSSNGKSYADWSKEGRLNARFTLSPPIYVKNSEALENQMIVHTELHNHQTSNQSKTVVDRLEVIRKEGDYKAARKELEKVGLASDKRNYSVLKPESQSPTVMTIADDYIHYNVPRALTVREMARLQSFDDSFVFQGKRSTGGNGRKFEVPQFTLVGNAVPPLVARAVAMEILKHIK